MAYARHHDVAATKGFWLGHPLFASLADYPEAHARIAAMVSDYSGWHWKRRNPMAPFSAAAADLGKVRAPALVVSGGRDVAGYREIADVPAASIPDARKLSFPEAGHVLPLEVSGRFNAEVLAFVARADSTATDAPRAIR